MHANPTCELSWSYSNSYMLQQDDLVYMGKVFLALACGSLRAFQTEHLATSLDLVNRNYSGDLKNLFL